MMASLEAERDEDEEEYEGYEDVISFLALEEAVAFGGGNRSSTSPLTMTMTRSEKSHTCQ